jgi:alkylated DNA repair dioxygenase AlkB
MDPMITNLISDMQTLVPSIHINSCLVNKYPDGNHSISPHRDSPDSFGTMPTIVILSLGETRTLMFENDMEKFSFDLASGSVFIMSGNSQKHYRHSLLKSDTLNCRYSLTFREFIL